MRARCAATEAQRRSSDPDSCGRLSFLYTATNPQNLHSFPTRRSSDLFTLGDAQVRRDRLERVGGEVPFGALDRRSEEHTSELQSRRDLVCRLLLEKKKRPHDSSLTGVRAHTPRRASPPHAVCRHAAEW